MPQSGQAFGREFCWGLLNTQKWQQVQEVSWTENSWEIGREYREHTICACLVPSFPGDPLITQNTSPGEPLVWPSRAAVIISFSVICLFFFFQEYSLLCYHFCDLFQELKATSMGWFWIWGCFFFFFQTWRNCPPAAWTCCLPFLSDGLFSFLLAPISHTCCKLCVFKDNSIICTALVQIHGRTWAGSSAQHNCSQACELRSLRFCGMRPTAGSAQSAELAWPVAVRNATETCDTGVLWDTGVGPSVTASWMFSKKAVSSAWVSFSQGYRMKMTCPLSSPQRV